MYNEQFKKRYIAENEYRNVNLRGYLTAKFVRAEEMETELGKDLYDFTLTEITNFYRSFSSSSVEVLMNLNAQLVMYTNYALNEHLVKDSQNHYEEVNETILRSCVNTGLLKSKLYTRAKVLEIAEQLKNPCEQFVILGLFEGICGRSYSDIAEVRRENFKGNEVCLPSGKKLKVSDELVHYMNLAVDEYVYVSYGKETKKNFRPDDDHVLKRFVGAREQAVNTQRSKVLFKIERISSFYNLPGLTPKALLESGRFEMILGFMKEDNSQDVEATILKHQKEIEYRYGKFSSLKRYIRTYGDIFLEKINKK